MIRKIFTVLLLLAIGQSPINAQDSLDRSKEQFIEYSVAKITDSLYAGRYEVTNSLYNTFLSDLASQNNHIAYNVAVIDSMGWMTPPDFHNMDLALRYQRAPGFAEYPVVNVSFEGARLFCKWLTEKYNAMPNKAFKKVAFRLPSEEEWMLAASGGDDSSVYSNGDLFLDIDGHEMYNYKHQNMLPAALDPLKIPEKPKLPMIQPSASNPDNAFGMYHVFGNVAEMTNIREVTKGGSFMDNEEALYIKSRGHYRKSSPKIGFRYFMEVLEQ